MAGPVDVAVVRWATGLAFELVPGGAITLEAGSEVIGSVLAAEKVETYTVQVGQTVATVAPLAIDFRGYTGATLLVPANFDGSVINVEVSADGSTWYPLHDLTGAAVQVASGVAVAGRAYDLPGEIGPAPYLRFACVTAQAGTPTVFSLLMKAL